MNGMESVRDLLDGSQWLNGNPAMCWTPEPTEPADHEEPNP